MNIILTENDKSLEAFDSVSLGKSSFKENLCDYFKANPMVYCNRCLTNYQVKADCDLYREVLSMIEQYPMMVSFEKCCHMCRESEACYYEVALLADEMIEYEVADKRWFFKEVSIEKRWNLTKQEIQDKISALKSKLLYIL